MKTLYKFISKTAESPNVFLFNPAGKNAKDIFGSGREIRAKTFEKIFSSFDIEEVFPAEEETISALLLPEDKAQKVYLHKIESLNEKFLLVVFSDKKNVFGPKKRERISASAEVLKEWLDEHSQKKYAAVPKEFFIPYFVYDIKSDEVVFSTSGFVQLLGFGSSNWNKNRFGILRRVKREFLPSLRKFFANLTEQKESYVDFEFTDNFGNERFLRCYAAPVQGEPDTVVGVILDITSEKHLRDRLENANAKFKTLLNISNDLIFSLNRSGYFMLVNDEGAVNLGYYPHELIGKHFLEIVSEEDKSTIALAFQKILKSSGAVTFDLRFIDKLNREIPFKITATSLKSGGEITGMIGYGKNFQTVYNEKKKLKELNEKLLEANRLLALERDRAAEQVTALEKLNELKNEFLSNISHELRTPLASIIGFSEAIAEDDSLSRELIQEFNEIILEESKRLTKLIDDILDYSKFEEGEYNLNYENFDLIELLRILVDNFKIQAEIKNINLKAEFPEAEFSMEGDRKLIEKAVSNVISNAVKFTNKDGEVTISVRNFLNEVSVSVSDTGIGIPHDELKNLFDKFKKISKPNGAHVPGAGLGLALAKKIVDGHGGTITVASRENEGTTVTITLPKKRSE